MELFIGTVRDPGRADRLEIAISGRGAFRRFKDVLGRWPGELDRLVLLAILVGLADCLCLDGGDSSASGAGTLAAAEGVEASAEAGDIWSWSAPILGARIGLITSV